MIAPLPLGVRSPKHEDQVFALVVQASDHRIGERLPAAVAVRTAPESTHGQDRVHRQHALNDPPLEASRRRDGPPRVIVNLPEDVLQRARNGQAVGHGETDAVIKAGIGIGVLPENHHPHAVERAEVEDAEQVPVHGTDPLRAVLLPHELSQTGEIGFVELRLQTPPPTLFDPDPHGIRSFTGRAAVRPRPRSVRAPPRRYT